VGARGADGGADGRPGRHALDGVVLPPKAGGPMLPGQTLRIETPGGGGCGAVADGRPTASGEAPRS
jgi:N-methylhydantoinase B/oxoprolinase/acetone carboxylase alpha subunit